MIRWQRGDTLIEVTVALAIMASVLSAGYALVNLSVRVGQTAKEHTQAINYVQEQAEALRSFRDRNQSTPFSSSGATSMGSGKFNGNFRMIQSSGLWIADKTGASANPSGYYPIAGTSPQYFVRINRTALTGAPVQKYRFAIQVIWVSNLAGGALTISGVTYNQSTIDTDLVDISDYVPCDDSVSGSCL